MTRVATASFGTPEIDLTDGHFDIFSGAVRSLFQASKSLQLFVTDVSGDELYELYLRCLPANQRQHHTCNCCKSFFRRYGNLAVINNDGTISSPLWDAALAPAMYTAAANQLRLAVERANIVSPFFSSEKAFGTQRTGFWTHFAVPNNAVFRAGVLSASEQMALKMEHFRTIDRALNEFKQPLVLQAMSLLEGDALYRSEKVKGPVQFLHDLHEKLRGVRAVKKQRNIIWNAIANAPAGFCTPRSGMAGTLLEDLASGMNIDTVRRRFDVKMRGDRYQRPTAAPKAGNIAQGNKIVERLGLDKALERRFAAPHEVNLVWAPKATKSRRQAAVATSGVFSGLATQPAMRQSAQVQKMTWIKFASQVLPRAAKINLILRNEALPLGAFTTEAISGSPQLFQWDGPLAWYLYVGGTTPSRWGLRAGKVEVVGIAHRPGSELAHHGAGIMLMLKGARDRGSPGLALFPECLRSEMHAVRSTIEAYSKSKKLRPSGYAEDAAGLIVSGSSKAFRAFTVEVDFGNGIGQTYNIDRWD